MIPLPAHDRGVPWPTESWPTGRLEADVDAERVERELDRVFREPPPQDAGETHAVVVAHRGQLVVERYGAAGGPDTALPS